jgi:hypothetical protein
MKSPAEENIMPGAIIDQLHFQAWWKNKVPVLGPAVKLVQFLNTFGEVYLFGRLRNLVNGDFHQRSYAKCVKRI